VIAFVLLACTQQGPELVVLEPEIQIAPPVLEFGPVGLLAPETKNLIVANGGRADLSIELSLDREEAIFGVDAPAEPWIVGPREEVLLPITFRPATFRRYSAQLRFDSNDEERPTVWVALRGEGADLPYPDIDVRPSRTVEIDGPGIGVVEVHNEGEEVLEVTALRLEGDPAFSLAVDPLDGTEVWPIAPGSSSTLLVDYDPPDPEGEVADLFIESNDPDESSLQVRLLGNGGGDFGRPVAVIDDCPTAGFSLAGPTTLILDGSASNDPGGLGPLTYEWRILQRPDGSDADIPLDPDDQDFAEVYVDVAGPWAVELVVSNALDTASEPAICSFGAAPADALYVELSWNTPNADMDLHLIEGNSTDIFQVPEDCNWCNQTPNWGASGPADDPRLDIDDLAGFGPENINLFQPRPGIYQVKVHYFRRNGDAVVNPRIRVWLNGAEATSTIEPLRRAMEYNEVWDVGLIDFSYPSAPLWIPSVTANRPNPGPRECFMP